MEITKNELAAVELHGTKRDGEIKELVDLELSFVGGGMGDIVLA